MKFLYVLTALLFVLQGFTAPNDDQENPALVSFIKACCDLTPYMERIKELRSHIRDINEIADIQRWQQDDLARYGVITGTKNPVATALTSACEVGASLEIINYLIQENADVNLFPPGLDSALYIASIKCSKQVVDCLLNNGADASYRSNIDSSNSILHAAILGENLEVIDLIVAKKPELLNVLNNDGNSPLSVACGKSMAVSLIKLLLAAGADPNLGKRPALHNLLFMGKCQSREAVSLLLQAGAQADFSREFPHPICYPLLVTAAGIPLESSWIRSPLADNFQKTTIQLLLNYGASKDKKFRSRTISDILGAQPQIRDLVENSSVSLNTFKLDIP